MKITETKRSVLEPKPIEEGFIMGKYDDPRMYAAIPMAGSDTKLVIFHQGKQLKICRNRKSALNFIAKHSKGKSVAKLPV